MSAGSWALLRDRRFGPLFLTQFANAFNDNFFKNALAILVTYQSMTVAGLSSDQVVFLATALLIAPYFLFSAQSGQLADRGDKAALMRRVKLAEIAIMVVGAFGLLTGQLAPMLFVVFAAGTQSTVFGPAKYAILPQLLEDDELVAGNALVEMGTYLAILLGTIAGGVLVTMPNGPALTAAGVLIVSVVGWWWSRGIPSVPVESPDLKVDPNPIPPTIGILRLVYENRTVWLSILGISWFWAFGAAFLSIFPGYTKDVVFGTSAIATLFLGLFSVGIGVGSILCERLSRERLELGLVPIGSIGLTLFTLDLFLVGRPWDAPAGGALIGLGAFLTTATGWRIVIDMFLIAVSGGFFIVPLYTLIQTRCRPEERSRVIAGNNIVNAALMVVAILGLMGLAGLGVTSWQMFAVLAVANGLVAIYIYSLLPEFFLRFCTWILSNVMYRLDVHGLRHIPADGPVVLVANHVTFIDWLIIAGACKRPARFVMDKGWFDRFGVRWLFRHAKVIPIASAKVDPDALTKAFDRISDELRAGEVVCIFPEGRLTPDGSIQAFRPGIEKIVERDPCPVVPIALNGLWGSTFSRVEGAALKTPFRRGWFSRVRLTVGAPIPPDQVTAAGMQETVTRMWKQHPSP